MKRLSFAHAKKKTKPFASLAAMSLIWQSLFAPALSIYANTLPEADPLSLDDDSLWLDESYSIQVQPTTSEDVAIPIMARAAGYVQEVHRIANSTYNLTELAPNWKTTLGVPKLKATLGGIDYTVFCIEPGIIHEKGGNMEAQDYYSQLTKEQKDKIDLILMYGYQNNGDTSDDSYIATQVAIWETVVGNPHYATVWWQLIRGNDTRERLYTQLMQDIEHHAVKPSFSDSTQTLDWTGASYDKTVTDSNKVLSKYNTILKSATVGTKTNQNQLTLTTPTPNLMETVELVKQAKYGGLTMYWVSNKQNLVSGGQGTPVKSMFTVKTPALGRLTIYKKGPQDEPISGVEFKITGPSVDQTLKTDQNGTIVLPDVKGGEYTVTEVSTPAPYLLNQTSQTITLKQGDSGSLTFQNEVPTGKVDIYKTGEQLSRVEKVDGGYRFVYEQLPLADTIFDLYAKETIKDTAGKVIYEKDTHVGRLTTNASGKASLSNLPLGKYYLKEVQAPAGLVVSTTVHEIHLSYKDASTSVVSASKAIENFRQKVELNLTKVGEQTDGSFKPLGNVSFGVYTTQDIFAQGKVVISKGSLVHTLKTKADGTGSVSLELPVGTYYVQEIAAPNEYVVSDEKFPFEFTGSAQEALSVKVNVNDGKVITNYLVRANLQLVKHDPNQKALANATFDLYTADDLLIGSYTTNEAGLIKVDNLIYGDYYLIERHAPNGYRLSDEKIEFSIKKNKETISLTAVNQPTRVEVLKVDIENQPLAGSTLQLLNEKNKVVSEWTSTTEAKVFENLAHGTYTLKEIAAPSGYQVIDPLTFDVTDQNEVLKLSVIDEPTQVQIVKKDALGNVVEGAHLQLLNEEEEVLTEWMSEADAMLLTSIPHGNYILREKSAPSGYVKAEDIPFTVTDTHEVQLIEMIDTWTQVSVQKVDHLDQPLAGATLQLIALTHALEDVPTTMLPDEDMITPSTDEKEGYEVVLDEWFTTGEGRIFEGLPHGTYLIREVGTPLGYQSIPDMTFEVTDENKVIDLKVVNKPTQLDITKYDEEGNKLFGATMQILDEQGTVLEEWTTTDETRTIEGLLPGNYLLREITAPDTFKKILDVPFEITNEEKIHVLEVTDELTKTTIHKVDEEGRYISGALLQVINEAGDVVREWETKREPMVLRGLPHGDYTLHEVKAPKGYLLAEDIKFAVTDSHEDLDLTMIDAFDPDLGGLPQTGFGVVQTVLFATLGVIAAAGAVYWVKSHQQ